MKRAATMLAVFLLGAFALHGCSASEHESAAASSPNEVGDWLTRVRNAHGRTDAALALGQPNDAIAALRTVLEQPVPQQLSAEHARIVQQDLWFRLAELELVANPVQALAEAEHGLSLGRASDLFTANLLVMQGRALQAQGRDTEAASSYHEALAIDERLLDAALGQGTAGEP